MAARRLTARDRFVAVSGALVLSLAVLGLVAVAERGAPSEHDLAPEGVRVQSEGSFLVVTQGTEVEGVCVPPGSCTKQTRVTWRLSGLPDAPAGLAYEAVLLRPEAEPLGPLQRRGDLHVLDARVDGDASDATALRLVLSGGGSGVVLHETALAGGGPDGAVDGAFTAAPAGGGRVRLEQVGAVSVSLLVDAEVRPPPPVPPGGVLRAWLQDGSGDDARFVHVGDLTLEGDRAVLDVREERIVRAQQDRFLVTLESGEAGDRPAGFPFFAADLRT